MPHIEGRFWVFGTGLNAMRWTTTRRGGIAVLGLAVALAGCTDQLDFDMRGGLGGMNTAGGVQTATAPRPEPDQRGVISYPGYQVAVARRGDTVETLAARVGLPAAEIARFNGLQPGATLRADEIVALPRRVPEAGAGSGLDIAAIAGQAIDRADATTVPVLTPAPPPGVEPVRHRVGRGETAYTVARLYDVSPRALADWNGLGPDLAVREGQYLLIPVAVSQTRADAADAVPPGTGTPTPLPPSAATPLPPASEVATATVPASPNLGATTTAVSGGAALQMPTSGPIVQSFRRGRSDGIRIGASAGSPVLAAEAGEVLRITRDTDQVQILLLRHPNGLLTIYGNVTDIRVAQGDRVRRGQRLAAVAASDPAFLHFEVRDGTTPVDPVPYLE